MPRQSKPRESADPRGVKPALEHALASKKVVTIRYHGGSTPGAYREILPLRFTLSGKLQALCMQTRAVKLFVFASIEITERRDAGERLPATGVT